MEDTAKELQDHAAKTQDILADAVENAEEVDVKRVVFRALTRLHVAAIKEFDTIARLETQAIDASAASTLLHWQSGQTRCPCEGQSAKRFVKTVDRIKVSFERTLMGAVRLSFHYFDMILSILIPTVGFGGKSTFWSHYSLPTQIIRMIANKY